MPTCRRARGKKAMAEQLAQELRNFMEQTNERFERTNQLILQAIQNMSNNNQNERTNPASGRDSQSNHSENEHSTQSSFLRPTLPPFLPREEPIIEEGEPTTNSVEELTQMYARLEPEIQRIIPFKEYYETKILATRNKRRNHEGRDIHAKIGKMTLPYFDGSGEETAQAWVQKLDTYLSLSPMTEENAIKFAVIHLIGEAHNWWHHGIITLGHKSITTYGEFTPH
jgi:hypothetical protein